MRLFSFFSTHHLVVISAWASKGIIAISQLLALKLLIEALGVEQYAVYVVLGGLSGWIALMDFGVGNALQNSISEARERKQDVGHVIARLAILLPALLLLFALALAALLLLAAHAPWPFLALASSKGLDVLAIACLVQFATAVGGIAYKIWYAEQQGWWANLLAALAAFLGVGLVLAARLAGYHDFLGVLLLYQLPPALLAVSVLLWRLFEVRQHVREGLCEFDFKPFLSRALGFFGFAFFAALVLQVDYFIMAAHASVYELVSYSIISRLFSMVTILHGAYLNAMWPVWTQLLTAGKGNEVERQVFRAVRIGVAMVIGFYLLFLAGREGIARVLLSGEPVVLPAITVSLMAGYYLIRVWCDSWAIVLLSASDLRPLWFIVPVQAVFSGGMQLLLVRSYGVNGIIVGLSLSYIFTVVWLLPRLARARILNRA